MAEIVVPGRFVPSPCPYEVTLGFGGPRAAGPYASYETAVRARDGIGPCSNPDLSALPHHAAEAGQARRGERERWATSVRELLTAWDLHHLGDERHSGDIGRAVHGLRALLLRDQP